VALGANERGTWPNQRMKLTGAAILVSRGMKFLQAALAGYSYRSAAERLWNGRRR